MILEDEKKLLIFSGNANPALASEIAAYLGTTVGNAFVGRFNNGEIQVMLEESVRGAHAFIIQPTCNPVNDSIMELLIMADACRLFLYKLSLHTVLSRLGYVMLGICACVRYAGFRKAVSWKTYRRYRSLASHGPIAHSGEIPPPATPIN